jgi:hypothetical protein
MNIMGYYNRRLKIFLSKAMLDKRYSYALKEDITLIYQAITGAIPYRDCVFQKNRKDLKEN